MDDREILEKIKKDRKEFSKIYRKYIDKIYKYCFFHLNRNEQDAEDITSQTFMLALEKIDTVFVDREHNYSILPFLYTIARNLVLKHWKKSGRTVSLDEEVEDIIPDLSFDESDLINEISSEDIMNLLEEIDPFSKDVIYMKIYQGYKFHEIAAQLNLKEAAVKMRYYRAIENVTKIINKRLNK